VDTLAFGAGRMFEKEIMAEPKAASMAGGILIPLNK
jgi:hypothetical protein